MATVKLHSPTGSGTLYFEGTYYDVATDGTVEVPQDAVLTLLRNGYRYVLGAADLPQLTNQPASVATDAAGAVADLNTLLANLKALGYMAPDA